MKLQAENSGRGQPRKLQFAFGCPSFAFLAKGGILSRLHGTNSDATRVDYIVVETVGDTGGEAGTCSLNPAASIAALTIASNPMQEFIINW
jgi:hypothetical protein